MLSDFQSLLGGYVRDDAAKLNLLDTADAIRQAVERYSTDRPRHLVEDLTAAGALLNLPTGWQADFSELSQLEYPVGRVPPTLIAGDRWSLYASPNGIKIMLLDGATGAVRATFTAKHVVSTTEDTVPSSDREAVAKYAAALLCEQLASFYASDTDSTIHADAAPGQTRSQAHLSMAREFRKQYQNAIGVTDRTSTPAGQTVQLKHQDSFGYPPLFHPRRGIRP